MKFKAIIFDMDGTIVDSTLAYELYIRRIMAEFGITPTQEDLDRLERELRRVNEQKFGNLVEETPTEPESEPEIKRLSYTSRNA